MSGYANNKEADAEAIFCNWIQKETIDEALGTHYQTLEAPPSFKFWLGRLLPECDINNLDDEAIESRLEPCASGLRFRVDYMANQVIHINLSFCCWHKLNSDSSTWVKSEPIRIASDIVVDGEMDCREFLEEHISTKITEVLGTNVHRVRIDVSAHRYDAFQEVEVRLINCGNSVRDDKHRDTRIYETSLSATPTSRIRPYLIDPLPDAYAYDRHVMGYGMMTGIEFSEPNTLSTCDAESVEKFRPDFWGADQPCPDLLFSELTSFENAEAIIKKIIFLAKEWGDQNWAESILTQRASQERWTAEMLEHAKQDAELFADEITRIEKGLHLLTENDNLKKSFCYMHETMTMIGVRKGYDKWRPFQFGFLVANLQSIINDTQDRSIVDVVWFATGGGKTETYLGLLITAIFYDRLRGKSTGISAWTRFPLRMLSLQQTQRFAEVIASADLIRQKHHIPGDGFSLGFFIGEGATPNRIRPVPKDGEPNINDLSTFERYKSVLQKCPYCDSSQIDIKFNRAIYTTDLICRAQNCISYNKKLPVHIVDHEIYRFLPTVVVGTLDKAAQIATSSGIGGFFSPPWGFCPEPGHGHSYAPRSDFPNGCLVHGCRAKPGKLPMEKGLYAMSFRLQDELHLLRDSLGAVDSHYESFLDFMAQKFGEGTPKILASSATLKGYKKQVEELYQRDARLFPAPEPAQGRGLWSKESGKLMRRYLAIAPRGLTLEWVTEQIVGTIQSCIRKMLKDPGAVCAQLGIDPARASSLAYQYGTQLVYGNTLRDIEAVNRSGDLQQLVEDQPVNWDSLTSRLNFDDVGQILKRLEAPENNYYDRIHALTASSMISHGVDVNRFNTMVMMGIPLTTSDFIQATARVGRRDPALVFVIHKIARERDAQVYRLFRKFIQQSDRFVEPVPITRRSRRVLSRTLPGIALARIIHEQERLAGRSLQHQRLFGRWITDNNLSEKEEANALINALGFEKESSNGLKGDVLAWYEEFWRQLEISCDGFLSEACPGRSGPMQSLRDVDRQIDVFGDRLK